MTAQVSETAREQLARSVTPELYAQIRRLWIQHSIAEDNRDIPGLMATLTPDCVYEIIPTGQRFVGHAGATEFYTTFLTAFPDVKFYLQDIVIGPQGVIEVAVMEGTQQSPWAGRDALGQTVRVTIIIHFPWDATAEKFTGEKVYFDRAEFANEPTAK